MYDSPNRNHCFTFFLFVIIDSSNGSGSVNWICFRGSGNSAHLLGTV